MKILHVTCSPRGQASESYRLSKAIIDRLLESEPTALLISRVLSGNAIPHIDESYASALGTTQRSPAEITPAGSMSLSEQLIQELEGSDVLIIATLMHNFTVPSVLKAWIDHVVRVRRSFIGTGDGRSALLRDRPVFIAVSSGARYSGEHARQPDFLTPYLKAVLSIIGLNNLTFFSVEGTTLASDAVAEVRAKTARALETHLASFHHSSRRAEVCV